jgi:hypothetical protein
MANRFHSVLLAVAIAAAAQGLGALGAQSAGATPKNAIEFFARTRHGTASCAMYYLYAGSTAAFCESFRPGRESKATVNGRGKVSICVSRETRSDRCGLGNAGENTPTFRVGRKVTVGPFRCAVRREGVRCVVIASGKGFLFSPARAVRVGPHSKVALAVPLAAAKPRAAGSKGSAGKVYVAANACNGHAFKPRKVTFACADGNAFATNLRYSSYGSQQAQATGTIHLNECTPNCAEGHFRQHAGKVRFDQVIRCADGRKYFSRARYQYGKRSASAQIKPFNCGK